MEARPRTTPRSHRLLSLHLLLLCTEPFRRRRLLKRLPDHDHPWTLHGRPRQHHLKETRPCLMEETMTPTATMRLASRRLLSLALFPLMLHQFLPGSLTSQRTTAQMTCTRLLRHADQLTVHRHHHLARLSNRHQCLRCHSQPLLHGRHQGNLLMCHELL
jgi:hypothetical protein